MGVLDTYNNADFGKNSAFNSGGSSGGGGGGGSFGNPTGSKRFSFRGYTATVNNKIWTVSFRGLPVASDVNNNTLSVNEQLARDWIESDIKRREAIEAGDNTPLDPGLADPDYSLPGTDNPEFGVIPDTNPQTQETELEMMSITDDQRFLIIGLAVTVALFGFIKR